MEQQSNERIAAAIIGLRLAKKLFPLHSLLTIYVKNETYLGGCTDAQYRYETSLYTNYFAGFKALVRWIGPIEIPARDYPPVHSILISYEVQEIAKILGCSPEIIWHTFLEVLNERYLRNEHRRIDTAAETTNDA